MLERLKIFIWKLFGIRANPQPREPDVFTQKYEDITGENITATIAGKLAMLTFADSTCDVDERGGQRGALVAQCIGRLWEDGPGIVAQAFGKGGMLLIPFAHGGHIDVQAVGQNRLLVLAEDGGRITHAAVCVDMHRVGERMYMLIADYDVSEDGVQTIRYRACDESGGPVSMDICPRWADIPEEYAISGTDRVLLGFLRCPRDNRRDRHIHGVPITYGVEGDLDELVEHIKIYRREYRLSRMMLGLDAGLWKRPGATPGQSAGIEDIRRTVQDGDDPFIPVESMVIDGKTPWQQYAPSIRHEAMEQRYNTLLRRVEKACGLSQGVLTERQQLNYANRDEVRAAQYDTFSVVHAMRGQWEKAVADAAYAVDVLAEYFGLTPAGARGQYEIVYDWDTSLIESSEQAYQQLSELQSRGMASKAELRQFVRGGTLEEAQAAIEEIDRSGEHVSAIDKLLSAAGDG